MPEGGSRLRDARSLPRPPMPVRADVSGSVLVFDEAHNIEDVCREGGSVDLSSSTMMEVRSCVW